MSSAPLTTNETDAALRVERAIFELRRGRALEIYDDDRSSLFASVERLDAAEVTEFVARDRILRLVISEERGRAMGIAAHRGATTIVCPDDTHLSTLFELAAGATAARPLEDRRFRVAQADARATAAVVLARHAKLIPALLQRAPRKPTGVQSHLSAGVCDIEAYPVTRGRALQRVSRARVPLADSEKCELIVYREKFGDGEHVAILIGSPDPTEPVPVRVHSACLTGDLLASLRCDCGDQLRGAIARIAQLGGGALLYLAHEGRGIGLANKLRAYALQDTGLNTLQADQHLGFLNDERDYAVACAMFRDLGFDRLVLMTNNPDKIAALEACDLQVVDRMPLAAPVNPHNARYMRTKREHAGHLDTETEGSACLE